MFALVLITLAFFASPAKAETDTFAQTTASNLNVRNAPNGKDVIRTLPHGSIVAVLQTQGVWSKVLYLENRNVSNPKKGWVSSQYLKVLYTKDVRDYADNSMAGI